MHALGGAWFGFAFVEWWRETDLGGRGTLHDLEVAKRLWRGSSIGLGYATDEEEPGEEGGCHGITQLVADGLTGAYGGSRHVEGGGAGTEGGQGRAGGEG